MKLSKVKSAIALGVIAASSAQLAHAGSAGATAEVTVVDPINVSSERGFEVQGAIANGEAYTIAVDTDGNATSTGPTILGESQAAEFTVTGTRNADVSITLPARVELTGNSNNGVIVIGALNHDAGSNPDLGSSGELSFNVGGTVQMTSTTVQDTYEGTMTVSVDY